MSTSVAAVETSRSLSTWRVADFIALSRPRIAVLVLAAVAVGAWASGPEHVSALVLTHTLIGTALVAASASALNQWIERELDCHMRRTAARPLPSGRLTSRQALTFGIATVVGGVTYLTLAVNVATAGFALATWLLYVMVYTPMKTRSAQNTAVGAIAGALPVLIGWASSGAAMNLTTAALAAIVYLWQFPHFGAIAWIYRDQYERAGMKMLSVVDPSGRRLARQAVVTALCLIPVSLLPAWECAEVRLYVVWALALGLAYLASSLLFAQRRDDASASQLLKISLIYMPAQLVLLIFVPLT
ncbi:MAG: heme o synthase [Pirellulales bacterium]